MDPFLQALNDLDGTDAQPGGALDAIKSAWLEAFSWGPGPPSNVPPAPTDVTLSAECDLRCEPEPAAAPAESGEAAEAAVGLSIPRTKQERDRASYEAVKRAALAELAADSLDASTWVPRPLNPLVGDLPKVGSSFRSRWEAKRAVKEYLAFRGKGPPGSPPPARASAKPQQNPHDSPTPHDPTTTLHLRGP